MYNSFFGFREKPFKLVPNPDFLYLSKSHQIALAHLTYAVDQGDGFAVITGEVGTGKTTLCRIFLERLEKGAESAYIFNPKLDSVQLLNAICNEFGIRTNHTSVKQLLDVINGYLIMKNQAGAKVVLLIDEAQNLSVENLEMVRMLSNLETTRNKLLQIILVGQPELGDLLDSHELRQLAQRISLSAHLTPLTLQETTGYIQHRVNIAAQRQLSVFTRGAFNAIYHYTNGIPRLINIVCDRALLTAYSLENSKVTASIAKQAIQEISSRGRVAPRDPRRRMILWAGAIAASLLVISVLLFNTVLLGSHPRSSARGQRTNQAATYPVAFPELDGFQSSLAMEDAAISDTPTARRSSGTSYAEGSEPPKSDPVGFAIDNLSPQTSRLNAVTRMLALWNQPAPHPAQLPTVVSDQEYFDIAAHQYSMRSYLVQWDWAIIKQIDLPAIVALRRPSGQQVVYLVLTRWENGVLHLSGATDWPTLKVDLGGVTPYLHGAVYVFWKNITGFDGIVTHSSPERSISLVKNMLRRAGYERLNLEPVFDADARRVVVDFQMRHNLVPDGLVGPLTKILLIKASNAYDLPLLSEHTARGGS
ncbi:MAG: AAA family ATPase [Desulfatitalea sp.]|nr:AAA family ATPase [Desulfatitalea sp.]